MLEGIHTFTETEKMRRATHTEVWNWVVPALRAGKIMPVTKLMVSARQELQVCLLALRMEQLRDSFNSDTEDEDFNGFYTELT